MKPVRCRMHRPHARNTTHVQCTVWILLLSVVCALASRIAPATLTTKDGTADSTALSALRPSSPCTQPPLLKTVQQGLYRRTFITPPPATGLSNSLEAPVPHSESWPVLSTDQPPRFKRAAEAQCAHTPSTNPVATPLHATGLSNPLQDPQPHPEPRSVPSTDPPPGVDRTADALYGGPHCTLPSRVSRMKSSLPPP